MADQDKIDLRSAINAISDVVQNRPLPLRIFDQIYMKAGDMVLQSEFVARWADGKKLAFIGDFSRPSSPEPRATSMRLPRLPNLCKLSES
jgi:hypothetical protein